MVTSTAISYNDDDDDDDDDDDEDGLGEYHRSLHELPALGVIVIVRPGASHRTAGARIPGAYPAGTVLQSIPEVPP